MIAVEVEHSKDDQIDKLLSDVGYTLVHKLGHGCDGSATCLNKAQDHIYVSNSFLENKDHKRFFVCLIVIMKLSPYKIAITNIFNLNIF